MILLTALARVSRGSSVQVCPAHAAPAQSMEGDLRSAKSSPKTARDTAQRAGPGENGAAHRWAETCPKPAGTEDGDGSSSAGREMPPAPAQGPRATRLLEGDLPRLQPPEASLGSPKGLCLFTPQNITRRPRSTVRWAQGGQWARAAKGLWEMGGALEMSISSPKGPASVLKCGADPIDPVGAHHQLRAASIPPPCSHWSSCFQILSASHCGR